MTLGGLVELHVHCAPDVRPRSCNDLELAREAFRVGARAVVLKSHHLPTVDRAHIAQWSVPGVEVYGGITLNPFVGGLNPAAVEAAFQLGAKIVWLPTLYAQNHRRLEGKSDGVPVVVDGKVVPIASTIFRQVAAADAILATGHHNAQEVRVIVAEAARCGVRKILINHPEHAVVGMTLADQRALLREHPVFFERCFAQPGSRTASRSYESNLEINLRAIQEIGVDSTVLASDVGQVENLPWTEAWTRYFDFLAEHGIGDADLRRMSAETPLQLLGINQPVAPTSVP